MPILEVEHTLKFKDSKNSHLVVVRTEDSSIFVGDEDNILTKYDKDLNLIDSLELLSPVQCAVAL